MMQHFNYRLHFLRKFCLRWCSSTKLKSDHFTGMVTTEMKWLWELFHKYNYELRFAGGVVRDLLLNKCPLDIDFATTATPSQMKKMFNKEGIRVLNTKGEKHGTVTVRINDKINFDVTTLRIHTPSKDGQLCVKFVQDWSVDAKGRDLTINSMFLGFDGTIYDYTNGMQDLAERKIVFVENPSQRIQEDYLRILRYFRFHGSLALQADSHDSNTLLLIKENGPNLSKISGERIWSELKKILSTNHALENMTKMIELGLTSYMGFPENANVEEFKNVWMRSKAFHPELMTKISALLYSEEEVDILDSRLKISTDEYDIAVLITNYRDVVKTADPLKSVQDLIMDQIFAGENGDEIKQLTYEICKYHGNAMFLQRLQSWNIPKFPISGSQLLEKGVKSGPELKILLETLRNFWRKSNYTASENELLNLIKI